MFSQWLKRAFLLKLVLPFIESQLVCRPWGLTFNTYANQTSQSYAPMEQLQIRSCQCTCYLKGEKKKISVRSI